MSADPRPQPPPRLRDAPDSPLGALVAGAAQASDAPASDVARARVWRALEARPSPRRRLAWLVPLTAALGLAAWLARPAREEAPPRLTVAQGAVALSSPSGAAEPAALGRPLAVGTRLFVGSGGRAFVQLAPGAGVLFEPGARGQWLGRRRLAVSAGAATISTGPGPLTVEVLGRTLEAEAAVFSMRIAPDQSLGVHVHEGEVWVRGDEPARRLGPGERWGPAVDASPAGLVAALSTLGAVAAPTPAPAVGGAPSPAGDAALYARAVEDVQAGRYPEALGVFRALSAGGGSMAEASLYEVARLSQRFLGDPAGALAAVETYRARFPRGPLAHEVSLTAVEAQLAQGASRGALAELNGFLATYPRSERANEVRLLRATLQRDLGDCRAALADYRALAFQPLLGDDASYYAAYCEQRLGATPAARRSLETYLRRFPAGRHRAEAAQALGR